jgi:hypothetical protein
MSELTDQAQVPKRRSRWPLGLAFASLLLCPLAALQSQTIRLALAQALLLHGSNASRDRALSLIRREGPAGAKIFIALYKALIRDPEFNDSANFFPGQISEELIPIFSEAPRAFSGLLPEIEEIPPGAPRAVLAEACLKGLAQARETDPEFSLGPELCARLARAIFEAPKDGEASEGPRLGLIFMNPEKLVDLRALGLNFPDVEPIFVERLKVGPRSERAELLEDLAALAEGSRYDELAPIALSEDLSLLLFELISASPSAVQALNAALVLEALGPTSKKPELAVEALLCGEEFWSELSARLDIDGAEFENFAAEMTFEETEEDSASNQSADPDENQDGEEEGSPSALILNILKALPPEKILRGALYFSSDPILQHADIASVMAILPALRANESTNQPWRRALAWIAIAHHRPLFSHYALEFEDSLASTDAFERIAALQALAWSIGSEAERMRVLEGALVSGDTRLRRAALANIARLPEATRQRLILRSILDSKDCPEAWPRPDREFIEATAWQDPPPSSPELQSWLLKSLEASKTLVSMELLAALCASSVDPESLKKLREACQRIAPEHSPPPGVLRALSLSNSDPQLKDWIRQWLTLRSQENFGDLAFAEESTAYYRHDEAFFRLIASDSMLPDRDTWLLTLSDIRRGAALLRGPFLIHQLLHANAEIRNFLTNKARNATPLPQTSLAAVEKCMLSFRIEDCANEADRIALLSLISVEPIWASRLRITEATVALLEQSPAHRSLFADFLIREAAAERSSLWLPLFGADLRGAPRLREEIIQALPARCKSPLLRALLRALLNQKSPESSLLEFLQSADLKNLDLGPDTGAAAGDFDVALSTVRVWARGRWGDALAEDLPKVEELCFALPPLARICAACILCVISPKSWNPIANEVLQLERRDCPFPSQLEALRKSLLQNIPPRAPPRPVHPHQISRIRVATDLLARSHSIKKLVRTRERGRRCLEKRQRRRPPRRRGDNRPRWI